MILHLYFARRFLATFLMVFGMFLAILFLIGMLEQIRKFDIAETGFIEILNLTLLKTPHEIVRALPLIMVITTLSLYLSLARTSELAVVRSTGRSAFRTLLAPLMVAFLIGVFTVAVLNPIVASTTKRYESVAGRNSGNGSSILSISREGLWLRQGGPEGQTVIRATRSNPNGTELYGVTFVGFGPDGVPHNRIEADSAKLDRGAWQLTAAKQWRFDTTENPEHDSTVHEQLTVPSSLTESQIRDSFGKPNTVSVWELSSFIDRLERAGLSSLRHRVWLSMELALPLMLTAMALVGATFSMRHTRFGRTGTMVLLALGLGFALYFIRNFAQILGENGQIPVLVAAWSPPVASVMLSIGILLNLEDG